MRQKEGDAVAASEDIDDSESNSDSDTNSDNDDANEKFLRQ
jgi:hypothetical protein